MSQRPGDLDGVDLAPGEADLGDLELRGLRHFELAATTLNFRAAAGRAHLSPAAFSESIHRLELTLGVVLFDRSTRSVRLSAAGARLLPSAQATLASARALRAAAGGAKRAWELTLGTRAELGLSWLTPALDTLAAADPRRTIHLAVGDSGPMVEALRAGQLDALVSSARLDAEELVSVPLHPEAYRFVGAPALLEAAPLQGVEDAARHHLLDIGPGLPLFRYLLDAVGGPVWPFQGRAYLGGIGAVRARALAGRGVAVLPEYLIRGDLSSGDLVELLPDRRPSEDTFRLVWRSGHPRAAALLRLAEELRALPLR